MANGTTRILTWVSGETTMPVVVQWKETAAPRYDNEVVLLAGSTRYVIRGLTPGASYTARVFYREQAPWKGESAAVTTSWTNDSTVPTCRTPDNPRAFAGSIDPATGGLVVDGSYGLEITATELPSFTAFEVAIETSPGAGTFGTYDPVPRGTIQSVQGARTVWRGIAPSDGKRRSIRAKSTSPGKTDSTYSPAVDVDPWTPTKPVDFPIACPTITLTPVTAMQAGVGGAKIRVSFTPPAEDWLKELRYSVKFKEPNGSYGASAIVRGTPGGPDIIDAQYGLVYEVTPSTVTSDEQTITEGVAKTITMPGVGAAPSITDADGVSTVEYAIAYDALTTTMEVWTAEYTSNPGGASQENAVAATLLTTLRRGDGRTALSVATTAGKYRSATFIPYAGVFRGEPITLVRLHAAATAPADLGSVSNSSKTSTTVTNQVNLAGSHVAGDKIETYRDGVAVGSLYTITSGDVTAGHALVTATGLTASTPYEWKYKAVRSGVRSANFTTPISVTTSAPPALNAPTLTADRDGSDPCGSATVTITPGANNPAGTQYRIESSLTGTGGWTVQTTSGVAGGNTITVTEDQTFFRALALANAGGTQSAYSNTPSIDDHTGPC